MKSNSIEQTIYQYSWAYDIDDMDLLMDCFVDDAVYITPAGAAQRDDGRNDDNAFVGGTEPLRGHVAIRSFVGKARKRRTELGHQTRHVISNVLIERAGLGASVTSYLTHLITQSDGTAFLDHTGLYLDQMVEMQGRWKIKERRICIDSDQNFPGRK